MNSYFLRIYKEEKFPYSVCNMSIKEHCVGIKMHFSEGYSNNVKGMLVKLFLSIDSTLSIKIERINISFCRVLKSFIFSLSLHTIFKDNSALQMIFCRSLRRISHWDFKQIKQYYRTKKNFSKTTGYNTKVRFPLYHFLSELSLQSEIN